MASDVYTLTIDGPGKNSLSTAVMQDVIRQVREADGLPILVAGAGDAFCAGLNLKEVATLDDAGMARFLGVLDDMIDALFDHPGPMVACVNGHAIAGGCVIALCAEVRVIADDPKIRMGLNEVALGLELPPKIMKLARHRLSHHQVERAVLEAGLYDPRTALALGFVDEVAADPLPRARALLDTVAGHPRPIYNASKATLREGAIALNEADRRRFRDVVLPRWTAPAVKEKVLAALKR